MSRILTNGQPPGAGLSSVSITPSGGTCAIIERLCDYLAEVGKQLVANPRKGLWLDGSIVDYFTKEISLSAGGYGTITELGTFRLFSRVPRPQTYANWLTAVRSYCGGNQERFLHISNLKSFLQSLAESKASVKSDFGRGKSSEDVNKVDYLFSFQPQLAGLGLGPAASGSLTQGTRFEYNFGTGVSYDFATVIIPALELCDIALRYLCPLGIPSISEAIGAYLSDKMDKPTLDCFIRLNGHNPSDYNGIIESNQSRLNAGELVQLFMREDITFDILVERMREIGFLRGQEVVNLLSLAQQIPPFTDLIRFMVRDVEDEALVNRFGMDADFDLKWTGQSEEWGRKQGVAREVMRRYWRAHWTIPSPTQLYEMYHRLRNRPENDPERVSLEDITVALQQQDILPFWIPKLLAISFNPLTRVDTQRAFFIGVLNRQRVKQSYYDIGYNEDNAETLTQFTERLKIERGLGLPWTKQYIANEISRNQLRSRLAVYGYTEPEIAKVFERADLAAEDRISKICTAATRNRFLLGEWDRAGVRAVLNTQGVDPERTERLIRQWECEILAKARQPRASEVCSWLETGVISVQEAAERLVRIGYSQPDALRIIAHCQVKSSEKAAKEAAAAAKRALAEQEKRAKKVQTDAEKLRRQQEAAAKARLALAAKRDAKEAKILKAAGKLADRLEMPIEQAAAELRRAIVGISRPQPLSDMTYSSIRTQMLNQLIATGALLPAEATRTADSEIDRMRSNPGYIPLFLSTDLQSEIRSLYEMTRLTEDDAVNLVTLAMDRLPDDDFTLSDLLSAELAALREAEASLDSLS